MVVHTVKRSKAPFFQFHFGLRTTDRRTHCCGTQQTSCFKRPVIVPLHRTEETVLCFFSERILTPLCDFHKLEAETNDRTSFDFWIPFAEAGAEINEQNSALKNKIYFFKKKKIQVEERATLSQQRRKRSR